MELLRYGTKREIKFYQWNCGTKDFFNVRSKITLWLELYYENISKFVSLMQNIMKFVHKFVRQSDNMSNLNLTSGLFDGLINAFSGLPCKYVVLYGVFHVCTEYYMFYQHITWFYGKLNILSENYNPNILLLIFCG